MSGQREAADGPSGRPVTAQEAIAGVVRTHWIIDDATRCGCGYVLQEQTLVTDGYTVDVNDYAAHVAAAVVEAVRALPAEQRAELLAMTQIGWLGAYGLYASPPAVQGQAHTERSE